MRQLSATIICLAALLAAPAIAQDTPQDSADGAVGAEPWLPSLLTDTPAEGFDLAVSMARRAVTTTQTDTEILYFATIAAANDYWRD